MFKALVLICVIVTPQVGEKCVVFKDTWGPYNTEENCIIRVDQMADEIFTSMASEYTVTDVKGACLPILGTSI